MWTSSMGARFLGPMVGRIRRKRERACEVEGRRDSAIYMGISISYMGVRFAAYEVTVAQNRTLQRVKFILSNAMHIPLLKRANKLETAIQGTPPSLDSP